MPISVLETYTHWTVNLHAGILHFQSLHTISGYRCWVRALTLIGLGVNTLGFYILGVYNFGLPVLGLGTNIHWNEILHLGFHALGVCGLGLPILGMATNIHWTPSRHPGVYTRGVYILGDLVSRYRFSIWCALDWESTF